MTLQPPAPQQPQLAPQIQPVRSGLPVWPKVIGIISVVLAGMGIIATPLLSLFNRFNPVTKDIMDHFPGWHQAYEVASAVGIGGLLLIAGILLLKHRPLAAPLYILWAILAIGSTILDIVVISDVLSSTGSDLPDAERMGMRIGMLATVPMGVAIPAFVLYWFCRAKTRQDLAKFDAPE